MNSTFTDTKTEKTAYTSLCSKLLLLGLVLLGSWNLGWGQTTVTFPANGTDVYTSDNQTTWTVPAGVSSVMVEVWGGGGGGTAKTSGGYAGGGGGGGAYARKYSYSVSPGQILYIQVGKRGAGGGASGGSGGTSYVKITSHSGTVIASAGGGGGAVNSSTSATGGSGSSTRTINSASPIVNDDWWSGGNGGGGTGSAGRGAGGGGGAGSGEAGSGGATANSGAGTGGLGGIALSSPVTSLAGGNGGGCTGVNASGSNGSIRGGGGGGAGTGTSSTGGHGGGGFVRITYTVAACTAPTITSGPTASGSACVGGSLTVSVSATGTSPTYKWQRLLSGAYADVTSAMDGGAYTNFNTATMTVNAVNTAINGRQFRCIVSNDCGSVESGLVTVSVNAAPTVATPATPSALCASGSYNPTAPTVTTNGSTVTSQGWQLETAVGSGSYAALTVPYTVAFADNGKRVRYFATNSCGTTNSTTVTLTVNDSQIAPKLTSGGITSNSNFNPNSNSSGSTINGQQWNWSVGGPVTNFGFTNAAAFSNTSHTLSVNWTNSNKQAGVISFRLRPNVLNSGSANESKTIRLEESADGSSWSIIQDFLWNGTTASPISLGTAGNPSDNMYEYPLTSTSRFVRFSMPLRGSNSGNFLIDNIVISDQICQGHIVSADFSSGSGASGSDALQYSINNGSSWASYTSGASINTIGATGAVKVRSKRDISGACQNGWFEFTLANLTSPSSLANHNDSKECVVNQNGFVHFTAQNGRLIASVNSNGQNLGNVTATSYVHDQPLSVASCDNPGLSQFNTVVMGRSWVIEPDQQPSNPVRVRLYYDEGEYDVLQSASQANSNQNDNLISMYDLGLTKYHNFVSPSLVNDNPHDNCSSGSSTFHQQPQGDDMFGYASSIISGFDPNGFYIEFEISSFSEFWLHGSSSGTPLPVALTSFSANCADESTVGVNWTTASEQNSSHFVLSRSKDGLTWTDVVTTEAAGTTNIAQEYYFIDTECGRNFEGYYRLLQVDLDGQSTMYNPIMVSCNGLSQSALSVQPNPTNGSAQFTASGFNSGSAQFCIQDVSGKRIVERQIEIQSGTIIFNEDLSKCARGVYLVKLFDQNGEFKTLRIIKD